MKRRELLKSGVVGAAISIFRPEQETKQLSLEKIDQKTKIQEVETTIKSLNFYVRLLGRDMKPVTEAQPFQFQIVDCGLTNKQYIQFAELTKRTVFHGFAIFTLEGRLWHYGKLIAQKTGLTGDSVILSLDPSILHLGWAIMRDAIIYDSQKAQERKFVLCDYGTILASKVKKLEFVDRMRYVLTELNELVIDSDVECLVIEKPEPWGSYKSLASSRSGSLEILTILTGALAGWCIGQGLEVRFIKVSQWKGQLPKHMTKKRMERKYNVAFKTTDEADAVGLGDWYLTNCER
jgi:hypothetical protein